MDNCKESVTLRLHSYLGINPIVHDGTYLRVHMLRIALQVCLGNRWFEYNLMCRVEGSPYTIICYVKHFPRAAILYSLSGESHWVQWHLLLNKRTVFRIAVHSCPPTPLNETCCITCLHKGRKCTKQPTPSCLGAAKVAGGRGQWRCDGTGKNWGILPSGDKSNFQ